MGYQYMTDDKNRFTRIDGLEALADDDAALKSFILEMNRLGREIEAKKKKAKRDLIIAPRDLSPEGQADFHLK